MTKISEKRALIVVDVQPSFLNERNKQVVDRILKHMDSHSYDLYIEATFHAEKGSLWERQQDWICPEGEETKTVGALAKKLRELKAVKVHKETKSAFKGDVDIKNILRRHEISEVHVIGLDTNDCVLATAYESFDLGFLTYVIEECCESSTSERLHRDGIEILKSQSMVK